VTSPILFRGDLNINVPHASGDISDADAADPRKIGEEIKRALL